MSIPETATPHLLSGVRTKYDKVRGNWVLLAPERAVKLDQIGVAILEETTGSCTFGNILDALSTKYNAPREQISGDVQKFLTSLIDRRMMEVRDVSV